MSRKFISFWLIVVPDTILLYLSLYVSVLLRYGHTLPVTEWNSHIHAFTVIFLLWLLVFYIHGLFEIKTFRRYTGLIVNLCSAMLVNLLLAVFYFYLQPNLILTPRRFLLIEVDAAFVFILLWQLLIKFFIKDRLTEGLYLFSFNNELQELEKEIQGNSFLGYRVLGHLNEQTLDTADFKKSSGVILPQNLNAKPEAISKFYRLRTEGISFYNHTEFYEQMFRRIYLSELNEIWFLENINYKEKRLYIIVKRITDIVTGALLFGCFLISYPFVSLATKLGSKGTVLFIQDRVGQNGKIFKIYKYRTMQGGSTSTWTEVNDPRITKVGKFLRKTRIDEWPQSMNLLTGDISLVGPRPEQVHIVESLRKQIPFYDERHLVKPGITGWAQLNIYAGSLEETKLKLQYDLYYIKRRSFLLDLEIIFKTIYYIFTWQGR